MKSSWNKKLNGYQCTTIENLIGAYIAISMTFNFKQK
jgi:hypothetical protein